MLSDVTYLNININIWTQEFVNFCRQHRNVKQPPSLCPLTLWLGALLLGFATRTYMRNWLVPKWPRPLFRGRSRSRQPLRSDGVRCLKVGKPVLVVVFHESAHTREFWWGVWALPFSEKTWLWDLAEVQFLAVLRGLLHLYSLAAAYLAPALPRESAFVSRHFSSDERLLPRRGLYSFILIRQVSAHVVRVNISFTNRLATNCFLLQLTRWRYAVLFWVILSAFEGRCCICVIIKHVWLDLTWHR